MRRASASVAAVLFVCVLAACSSSGGGSANGGGCTTVNLASSPEKVTLLTQLASDFNNSKAAHAGGCATVKVQNVSSGAAADKLASGWPDDGTRPVVWSPAASSWGAIVNQRRADQGQPALAPADAKPIQVTPLVIAMPQPMAQALGWPSTPIGWSDILALARDPNGWAGKGHPEWGPFKLGKTNPNFSTSALNATIAQYYAATGKQRDLTVEDLDRPDVDAFMRSIESTVVHYGDTTLTFLNNWYRNDSRGTALTYVSAVAVEEKSVIDYNKGNPDGILQPGERPKPPRVPLVAVYPKEGTLFSDSPFYTLNADWVTPQQRTAAQAFEQFVDDAVNQRKVLSFGFRPGNPAVAVGDPIVSANGVDPNQPQTTLGVPAPPVLVKIIQKWGELRKPARVLMVIDVSGSMGDQVAGGATKLDLVKQGAIQALGEFSPNDQVGLRIFSTNISSKEPTDYLDLVPIGPIATQREQLAAKIQSLVPQSGTPLYTTAVASYEDMKRTFDPAKINAVVLLTDGKNDDPRNNDLDKTLAALGADSEGVSATPVRLFTIAYGQDADKDVLRRMAEATNGATYDASNPQTINNVFTAVISNF